LATLAGATPRARRPAVQNGHIKRITDGDIQSSVLEVAGNNVSTTYISCPAEASKTLGIKLPFLVMIIKNLKKYFTFEVTVLDDKGVHRRFRASNYQVRTTRSPSASPTGRSTQVAGSRACLHTRTRLPVHRTVHDARQALHLHDAHAAG
jgi:hypothetical protein